MAIVGTRPNLIKLAPLARALAKTGIGIPLHVVHTGQHYDSELNASLVRQLDLPEPDVNLAIGSGPRGARLGAMLQALDPVMATARPQIVVVFGDTDSSLAGALAGSARHVPIAHVEAGLRSFDRGMPEENNRVIIDHLSELLFASEPSAIKNLRREGLRSDQIHFVGNVMIDSLRYVLPRIARLEANVASLGRADMIRTVSGNYGVVTLHRPDTVDRQDRFEPLARTLARVAGSLPLIFPVHPRTAQHLTPGLAAILDRAGVIRLPPLGYLEMLSLMRRARLVLTDSGGIQEETTALGVPCLTLRTTTERPATVEEGTNVIVGTEPEAVEAAVASALRGDWKHGSVPALWDGRAAERIAQQILGSLRRESVTALGHARAMERHDNDACRSDGL
jgi:UDP-N-acetylglucosamine 2-epimerase (non-hydrolysing)